MIGEVIDKLVGVFSPKAALDRTAARLRYKALSTYDGASKDRTTYDWRAPTRTADGAILSDWQTLLARSRQMMRDNGDAKSILGAYSRNVIHKGIYPLPQARDQSGFLMTQWNTFAHDLFKQWASDRLQVDAEGRKTFHAMQLMAVEQMIEAGEVFIVKRINRFPQNPNVGLTLQMFEPEHLADDVFTRGDIPLGHEVRRGIEVNAFGRPVAYWFRVEPDLYDGVIRSSSFTNDSVRVPANQVLHLYRQRRPRQSHGVPELHAVLRKLRMLEQFDGYYLESARLEAAIALIINKQGGPAGGLWPGAPTGTDTMDASGNRYANIEGGMIFEGELGENVSGLTQSRPGGTYAPFVSKQQRSIAAAAGIDYETMARDFTGGTYSSLRQGLLESRREYEVVQELVIDQFIRPVYLEFLFIAVMEGKVEAPSFFSDRQRWEAVNFRRPRWPWIDPTKEVTADVMALQHRLNSHQRQLESMGHDWQEVFEEVAEAERVAGELGIKIDASKPAPPEVSEVAGDTDPADEPDDDEQDNDPSEDSSAEDDDLSIPRNGNGRF